MSPKVLDLMLSNVALGAGSNASTLSGSTKADVGSDGWVDPPHPVLLMPKSDP